MHKRCFKSHASYAEVPSQNCSSSPSDQETRLLKCASRASCHLFGRLLALGDKASLLFGVSRTPHCRHVGPFEQQPLCPSSSHTIAVLERENKPCRAVGLTRAACQGLRCKQRRETARKSHQVSVVEQETQVASEQVGLQWACRQALGSRTAQLTSRCTDFGRRPKRKLRTAAVRCVYIGH